MCPLAPILFDRLLVLFLVLLRLLLLLLLLQLLLHTVSTTSETMQWKANKHNKSSVFERAYFIVHVTTSGSTQPTETRTEQHTV